MSGKIIGISGPTVTVDLAGLGLFDQVRVGQVGLKGEVVRLAPRHATVQVYEETRGLGVGEPAAGLLQPLTVRLGPGLLHNVFDGLQRPLTRMAEEHGPFIRLGQEMPALDGAIAMRFVPQKQVGDILAAGDLVGVIEAAGHRHPIRSELAGELVFLAREGPCQLPEPVARLKDGDEIMAWHDWPVRTPRPYRRKLAPTEPLITGQRSLDFLFPLARGGTAIFPGGFGTGKTILEQSIAKYADADIVVYVGCGERGNEMAEMLEEFGNLSDPWTGQPLMTRTIMVVNTSNMPVAAREASIYTAVTMAEYYRDMGCHVLLLADSISRWAEALREVSSALEEMPGEEGYPTYLASRLSGFFARAGVVETLDGAVGSLTMILSVSPPGGDFTDPVTQACLRTAGCFLMLDTNLAHRRHFPAINWFQSYSLYESATDPHYAATVRPEWPTLKQECRELLKREEKLREVSEIVGAEGLQDADHLLMDVAGRIRAEFLCQNAYTDDAFSSPELTFERIAALLALYRQGMAALSETSPAGKPGDTL